MTDTIEITNRELLTYGEQAKRGEIHLLRMTVLKARTGYELTFSDEPYQTWKPTKSND